MLVCCLHAPWQYVYCTCGSASHLRTSLARLEVELFFKHLTLTCLNLQGQNLCFSLGTNPKSQTAIGLCSKEKTVPTAYYMQESEKILLLKGDTDNDYLLMANTTNLISTVEGNKFDSLYTKQADFCGPTITDIKDRPDSSPTLCKGKEITGSYSALMTGMRVGEPDTAGGYVGISYALVMKGPVFLNVAKNFITLSNYGERVYRHSESSYTDSTLTQITDKSLFDTHVAVNQCLLLADGTYIYRTTCLNGYNKTIAAATPEKSIESALNEKFASGSHNDPVNPSLSPAICGADTKFDEGTIKFSVYSEFAGDKSQVAARNIHEGLPGVYRICRMHRVVGTSHFLLLCLSRCTDRPNFASVQLDCGASDYYACGNEP